MFWIVRRRPMRRKRTLDAATAAQVEELRRQAKAYLPGRINELANLYGFQYNTLRIKHNSSNWGSCSSKGNINLNLNLMRVPQDLQDYVMLHELCHLKYLNHSPQFHALLESVCPGHREKQRRLKEYKLI
ncbi:MAG: M48 family metallopeptidase [Bacteroidales bacterium]|nr:M48 family metallopeptidase [Bacteroidales bacterium]